MPSAKWRPFCLGLNVLSDTPTATLIVFCVTLLKIHSSASTSIFIFIFLLFIYLFSNISTTVFTLLHVYFRDWKSSVCLWTKKKTDVEVDTDQWQLQT